MPRIHLGAAAVLALLCVPVAHSAVVVSESTQINLLRGSTTIATLESWEACRDEAHRLANADTRTSGKVTYRCQTERRQFVATYSADPPPPVDPPPPPPPPVDPLPPPTTDGRQGKEPVNPVTAPITGARTFSIGPGKPDTFDSVPWGTLQPGDVVNIYHQPQAYVAKIGLRARGTAAAPVIINGVTDAQGNRPVITFAGARTAAGSKEAFTNQPQYGESLGGIVIKRGPTNLDPYDGPKPSHIQIKNLEVRDARGSYTTLAGGSAQYSSAACIYAHVVTDLLIQNVIATGCAFGIFTMAKDELLSQTVERITVRNSRIFGNGVPGSYYEHNAYVQADSPIIEGNFIGKVLNGSEGSSFKDRSARLIFRHNYVESSARAIDLVHSEEQSQGIAALPHYGTDYVYGNTIINDSAGESIHYGGDNLGEQESGSTVLVPKLKYRAHLYFWGNDVTHKVSGWRNTAFGLSLKSTIADVWGNKFTFGPEAQTHYWLEYSGDLRLGANTVNGKVEQSGRDGSNAAMYRITTNSPIPDDAYLRSLME